MCNVQWARKVQCAMCMVQFASKYTVLQWKHWIGTRWQTTSEAGGCTSYIHHPPTACNCTIVQIVHCQDIVSRVAARIAFEPKFLLCNWDICLGGGHQQPLIHPPSAPCQPSFVTLPTGRGGRGLSPALADTPHLAQSPLKLVQLHAKVVKMSVRVGIFVGLW